MMMNESYDETLTLPNSSEMTDTDPFTGGYWNVDYEAPAGGSSTVTLCVSKYRLSLLVVNQDDHNIFTVQAEYKISSIVRWKLDYVDRQRCHVVYLDVNVAPDDDLANCNFSFRRFNVMLLNVVILICAFNM